MDKEAKLREVKEVTHGYQTTVTPNEVVFRPNSLPAGLCRPS